MFSVVLLGSCTKERILSVKFTIEDTICDDGQTGSLHSVNFSALTWSYAFNAFPDVISVPFAKRSDDMTVEEGDNITISAERDNRRNDSNGCGGANVLVEVYINDEVVETRTLNPGTWSSSGNSASFTYIVP